MLSLNRRPRKKPINWLGNRKQHQSRLMKFSACIMEFMELSKKANFGNVKLASSVLPSTKKAKEIRRKLRAWSFLATSRCKSLKNSLGKC